MAITIEPLGGLGNQLFVYATGLARAIDLQTELRADLRLFGNYEWHNYELDSFENGLSLVKARPQEIRFRRAYDLRRRVLRKIHLKPPEGRGEFVEESTHFDARVAEVPDGTRLRGYFQSHKYFTRHAHEVRTRVRKVVSPSHWYLKTAQELALMPRWSAVHVRRGNYVALDNMGLADDNYYRRALKLLNLCAESGPLVVFSDDTQEAKMLSAFVDFEEIRFIEAPAESRPIESLLLMSGAHHIVTANSTFSWWAAWLNDRPDRIVICPRPWLDDARFDDRDLLPADWLTVGRGQY